MADIDPYVQAYFLRTTKAFGLPETFERQDLFLNAIVNSLNENLNELNVDKITDTKILGSEIFREMLSSGALEQRSIPFAGNYFKFVPQQYINYRNNWLSSSEVHSESQEIGSRYFPEVFAGYTASVVGDDAEFPEMGLAPAANRIVRFNDNQSTDLASRTDEIARQVDGKNRVEGPAGLKELVLGQLRAGRELILAGVVRLQILQITLLETLQFLAGRYEGEIVGTLASALLAELLKLAGLSS